MSVCAIVGGQFGSEGKGAVVAGIAGGYNHHVRVGAANAGHTLYTFCENDGHDQDHLFEKHVMQQLPCAAYANPDARLYLGPGAQISPEIFEAEIIRNAKWRKQHGHAPARIFVDYRAHVITPTHIEREQRSKLAERIGSTSTIAKEGIGAAQAARVMRDESCVRAEDWFDGGDAAIRIADVPYLLHDKEFILLEGTQGTGLSLTTGFFPFTTSRNTTAGGLAADAGIAPNRVSRIIAVHRSFPIRVAGPSGPFYMDSQEVDWESLGVDSEKERTTVTKKVRRVATFSAAQTVDAAILNGATEQALMFADYLDKKIAGGAGNWTYDTLGEFPEVAQRVLQMESLTGVPVTIIGTGPHSLIRLPAQR